MSNTTGRQVQRLFKKGGSFDPSSDLEAVQAASAQAELAWCVADCERARNRSAVFRAVVKAVDYPQFFGSSFEGLFDCLCDSLSDQRVGLVLLIDKLHSADPALKADLPGLTQILDDVVTQAVEQGRIFIYGISHAGKHPEALPGVVHSWSDDPS
jgi:hypothetical protein